MNRPVLDDVTLDRSVVVLGGPVTVRWAAHHADVVTIDGHDMDPVTIDVHDGRWWAQVTPRISGTLRVSARSGTATVTRVVGPVTVFDPAPAPRLPFPAHATAFAPPPPPVAVPLPAVGALLPPAPPPVDVPEPVGVPVRVPAARTGPGPVVPDLLPPVPEFGLGPSAFPFDLHSFFPPLAARTSDPEAPR